MREIGYSAQYYDSIGCCKGDVQVMLPPPITSCILVHSLQSRHAALVVVVVESPVKASAHVPCNFGSIVLELCLNRCD